MNNREQDNSVKLRVYAALGMVLGVAATVADHIGPMMDVMDSVPLSAIFWAAVGFLGAVVVYGLEMACRRLFRRLRNKPDAPMTDEEYRRRTRTLIPGRLRLYMILGFFAGVLGTFRGPGDGFLIMGDLTLTLIIDGVAFTIIGAISYYLEIACRRLFKRREIKYPKPPTPFDY